MLVTFSDSVAMGNTIEQYTQVIRSFHSIGPLLTIKICRRTEKYSRVSGQSSLFLPLLLLSSWHSSTESRCGRQSRYSPYYLRSYIGIQFKESFQSLGYTLKRPSARLRYMLERPFNHWDTLYRDTQITKIHVIETFQSLGYSL